MLLVLVVLAVLAVVVVGGVAFLVTAMRTKSPRLLGVVRRFNRGFTNKLSRRSAGQPGVRAALVRHRGRASGRLYETPVEPFPTGGGFLISLPYGADTDWVKNVLAAGSAVLVSGGQTYTVDRPEVLAVASVEDEFPPSEQRNHRWFRVEQCLRVSADAGQGVADHHVDDPGAADSGHQDD